jgi:hypothetical protein
MSKPQSDTRPRLIRYEGILWDWWGGTDHQGRLILRHLTVDGYGTAAKQEDCYEIVGDEYSRQIEAIEYFRAMPASRPHTYKK